MNNEMSYNPSAMDKSVECSRSASSYAEEILTKANNMMKEDLPANFKALDTFNTTLYNGCCKCNDISNRLLKEMLYIRYVDNEMYGVLSHLTEEDSNLLRSAGIEINEDHVFTENKENGFEIWYSDKRYSIEDFANSEYAKFWGWSAEEAYQRFVGVCIAESEKTPDSVLSVVSVALNRCESINWKDYYTNGTNPVDQMWGGDDFYDSGQYESFDSDYNTYKMYTPYLCDDGKEQCDKNIASHTEYTYDELAQVVDMALETGIRNNDYTGFFGGNTGKSGSPLKQDDKTVFFYISDADKTEAEANKVQRLATQDQTYSLDDSFNN